MLGPMWPHLLCLVPLRIMVLPMVLALISTEWVTVQSIHSSRSSEICCYHSRVDSQILKITSKPSVTPWVSSPPGLPMLNRSSIPSLPRWSHLQKWNLISVPSRTLMLDRNRCSFCFKDLGRHHDQLMSPQPQGPMAQDRPKTTGTQDADLIHSQTWMMKMLEVPSYDNFHVNKSILECPCGSISSLQRLTCTHPTGLSGFIVKQVWNKSQMSRLCGTI